MKEKFIREVRSKKNGIIFYSNQLPEIGVLTFIDDSGKIQSKTIPVHLDELSERLESLSSGRYYSTRNRVLVFDVILILICLFSMDFHFVLASIYFSILVSFKLFTFIDISYQMKSNNGKDRSLARFHAAEHMAINAYEKYQRIPTFEEIKRSSRFSKSCGSMKHLKQIAICSLISLSVAFLADWNSIAYFISLVLIVVLSYFDGWIRFLQIFITSKPSDKEIEVAIEGLKNFEELEDVLLKDTFCVQEFKDLLF